MLKRVLVSLALGSVIAGCGSTVHNGEHTAGAGGSSGASGGSSGGSEAIGGGTQSGAGPGASQSGVGGGDWTGGASGSGGDGGAAGARDGSGTGGLGEAGESGVAGSGGSPDVPGFDDLIIRSEAMGDFEGLAVFVAYDHNITPNSRSEDRSDVIASGSFEVMWRQGFDQDTFGTYAFVYVDTQGDGECTENVDPVWWFFVNNLPGEEKPVIATFDPAPDSGTNALEEITCEVFVKGLSG